MFTLVEHWEVAAHRAPRRMLPTSMPSPLAGLSLGRVEGRWAGGAVAVVAHLSILLLFLSLTSPSQPGSHSDLPRIAMFEARMIEEHATEGSASPVNPPQTSTKVLRPVEADPPPLTSERPAEWVRNSVTLVVEVPWSADTDAHQAPAAASTVRSAHSANASGYDPYASAAMPSASYPMAQAARVPACLCRSSASEPGSLGCENPDRPPCASSNLR